MRLANKNGAENEKNGDYFKEDLFFFPLMILHRFPFLALIFHLCDVTVSTTHLNKIYNSN